MESDSLMGLGFLFGGSGNILELRQWQWSHSVENIPNITELCTFKMGILCYMNISISKYMRISPLAHGKLTPIGLVLLPSITIKAR